jgi:hypothetical protein
MNYVLYPRPAGFQNCMDIIRADKNIAERMVLHDVTVGYCDLHPGIRTSHHSMLSGKAFIQKKKNYIMLMILNIMLPRKFPYRSAYL